MEAAENNLLANILNEHKELIREKETVNEYLKTLKQGVKFDMEGYQQFVYSKYPSATQPYNNFSNSNNEQDPVVEPPSKRKKLNGGKSKKRTTSKKMKKMKKKKQTKKNRKTLRKKSKK